MKRTALVIIFFAHLSGFADGGRIEKRVIESVVQVVTPPQSDGFQRGGTGLLLGRLVQERDKEKAAFVLVTNKHMIGHWNPVDGRVSPIFE